MMILYNFSIVWAIAWSETTTPIYLNAFRSKLLAANVGFTDANSNLLENNERLKVAFRKTIDQDIVSR